MNGLPRLPCAKRTIAVHYKSRPSTAQGLEPKTADADGNVSWTWMVGRERPQEPGGSW